MFNSSSFLIGVAFLIVLALGTAILALYRFFLARHEDTHIHTGLSDAAALSRQSLVASKLALIDKWGKALTVATLVYFLGLLLFMLYSEWMRASTSLLTE